MGLSCGTNFVRYLFFAFNFVFWVLGLAVLGVGIYSRVENDTWRDLIDSDTFLDASNLLVAAGVIVAILGFFGCLGALKKLKLLLCIYAGLVILIFILEIAGGAYAYDKRESVEKKLTSGIEEAVNKNYGYTSNTAAKGMSKVIDWFQRNVECCGVSNPADWQKSNWYSTRFILEMNLNDTIRAKHVPDSCCKTKSEDCGLNLKSYNDNKIYNEGCVAGGKRFAKDNLYLVGGVGIGIAVVELLAIGFAIGLIIAFKKEDKGETA